MSLKSRVKKLEAKPNAKAAAFEMPAGDRAIINDFLNVFMVGGKITDELQMRIDTFNEANDCDLAIFAHPLEKVKISKC